jgi:hypothetical protein
MLWRAGCTWLAGCGSSSKQPARHAAMVLLQHVLSQAPQQAPASAPGSDLHAMARSSSRGTSQTPHCDVQQWQCWAVCDVGSWPAEQAGTSTVGLPWVESAAVLLRCQ